MANVYVVGSLRKKETRQLAAYLRDLGHDVFDEWHAAGPRADDEWRDYFKERGMRFSQALRSAFVEHIVAFDKKWIDWSDAVVVIGPAGVSATIELHYAANAGKQPILYLEQDPERWDAMLLLVPGLEVVESRRDLADALTEPWTGIWRVARDD